MLAAYRDFNRRLLLPIRRSVEGLPDAVIHAALRRMRRERYYKGNGFIGDLLTLLFQNTAQGSMAAIGSGFAATGTAGSLYLSLHSADPGVGGNQSSNEVSYTGYARLAIARSSSGFTISGESLQFANNESFAQIPANTAVTASHWVLGTASSGNGHLLYAGVLGSNIGAGTALTSNNVFTVPSLGSLANGNEVPFYAPPGSTLPGGVTQGTLYYVISISGDTFKISTTSGGSAVTITADGEFLAFQCTPVVTTSSSPAQTPTVQSGTVITEW